MADPVLHTWSVGEALTASVMNADVRDDLTAIYRNVGWISAGQTWTYASATTITVPSGAAAIYDVGDKIKLTDSTVKYFYVVAVADTLLTVTGGSTYSLSGGAITLPYYSKAASPNGFPQWLPYTPTGVSASNSTKTGRFILSGRRCLVQIYCIFTGGITFTTMPSLPITASANILYASALWPNGVAGYYDNGVGNYPYTLVPTVLGSGTTVVVYKTDTANTLISATVPITWANGDGFYLQFEYEI
jgi:hypothetical protein